MSKKKCPKCHELNSFNLRSCCICGETLKDAEVVGESDDIMETAESTATARTCPNCGEEIGNSTRNCKYCGSLVAKTNKDYHYSSSNNNTTYYTGTYSEDTSIGTWILILIGLGIPILNIIVLLGLAFGSSNDTLRNFGKASLILLGVGLGISILLAACGAL